MIYHFICRERAGQAANQSVICISVITAPINAPTRKRMRHFRHISLPLGCRPVFKLYNVERAAGSVGTQDDSLFHLFRRKEARSVAASGVISNHAKDLSISFVESSA